MTGVDTFDVELELPLPVAHQRRGVQTSVKSGTSHRRQTQSSVARASGKREMRIWSPSWQHGLRRHYDRLQELFDVSMAGALPLTFTPPGESALDVKIVRGSFVWAQRSANHFEMSIQLREEV